MAERLPAKNAIVEVSSTDHALWQIRHEMRLCSESEALDPDFVRLKADLELASAFLRGETADVDPEIRAKQIDRFIGIRSVIATACTAGDDGAFKFEGLEPIEHLLTVMCEEGAEEMPVTPPASGLLVNLETLEGSSREKDERKHAGEEDEEEEAD